jgi:hypothetical protein
MCSRKERFKIHHAGAEKGYDEGELNTCLIGKGWEGDLKNVVKDWRMVISTSQQPLGTAVSLQAQEGPTPHLDCS